MCLDELPNPQTASVTAGSLGRQSVISADHLIAIRDVGTRTQKKRTIVGHVVEKILRVTGHHLDMLEGQAVCLSDHFFLVLAQDHSTVVCP